MSLFQSFPNLRELNITSVVDTFVPVGQTWLIKNIVIGATGLANIGFDIGGTYHIVPSNDPKLDQVLSTQANNGNEGNSKYLGNSFGVSYILQAGDHISSDLPKSGVDTGVDFTIFYYILESDYGLYLEGWPTPRRELYETSVNNTSQAFSEIVTVPTGETWFITSIVAGFDLDEGGTGLPTTGDGTITIKKSGGSLQPYLQLEATSEDVNAVKSCRWVREALPSTLVLNAGGEIKWAGTIDSNSSGNIAKTEFKISYYVYELDFPQT